MLVENLAVNYRRERQGEPLADGHYGVFLGIKGDYKWQLDAFGWSRYYGKILMCHRCLAAKRGEDLFTDFGETAHWRTTIGRTARCSGSLLKMPGFEVGLVWDDLLHLFFVNGIANDLMGAALVALASYGAFGGDPVEVQSGPLLDTRLRQAFNICRQWCRQHQAMNPQHLETVSGYHGASWGHHGGITGVSRGYHGSSDFTSQTDLWFPALLPSNADMHVRQ